MIVPGFTSPNSTTLRKSIPFHDDMEALLGEWSSVGTPVLWCGSVLLGIVFCKLVRFCPTFNYCTYFSYLCFVVSEGITILLGKFVLLLCRPSASRPFFGLILSHVFSSYVSRCRRLELDKCHTFSLNQRPMMYHYAIKNCFLKPLEDTSSSMGLPRTCQNKIK